MKSWYSWIFFLQYSGHPESKYKLYKIDKIYNYIVRFTIFRPTRPDRFIKQDNWSGMIITRLTRHRNVLIGCMQITFNVHAIT